MLLIGDFHSFSFTPLKRWCRRDPWSGGVPVWLPAKPAAGFIGERKLDGESLLLLGRSVFAVAVALSLANLTQLLSGPLAPVEASTQSSDSAARCGPKTVEQKPSLD